MTSTTVAGYYALLEQGRAPHPSSQVIDALAIALGLVPSERAYLQALAAGEDRAPSAHQARETLAPGVAELVARLDPHPTYVTGRRTLWKRHDVVPLGGGRKRLRHPELGEITLQHVVLQIAENPDHKLVTFAPTPDDERRIAVLISQTDPTR